MSGVKNVVIFALVICVAAFAYLYLESRRSTVEVNLPGISIEKK